MDLFMAYFKILDVYVELCWGDITKLWEIYSSVDNFVKEVKNKLNIDTFILIISNHGMKQLEDMRFANTVTMDSIL